MIYLETDMGMISKHTRYVRTVVTKSLKSLKYMFLETSASRARWMTDRERLQVYAARRPPLPCPRTSRQTPGRRSRERRSRRGPSGVRRWRGASVLGSCDAPGLAWKFRSSTFASLILRATCCTGKLLKFVPATRTAQSSPADVCQTARRRSGADAGAACGPRR
jgi:hypothetical protein